MIEIIAVVAIVGLMGATIVPLVFHQQTGKRGEVTEDRLEEFKKAIIGNPFVIGDDVRSSFGYVGDMGNLPASLQNLYIQGVQPAYSYNSTLKIGSGWRGPYLDPSILEDLATLQLDAYKQQLVYSTTAFTDVQTGVSVVGRLTSTGPNRTEGGAVADDRSTYIFRPEAFSTVSGFVKDILGNRLGGVTVKMNYPVNGSLTQITTTTGDGVTLKGDGTVWPVGYFNFSLSAGNPPNIPYGNRSITVEPKLVYAPGSARTFDQDGDGIYDDIELNIVNLSNTNIQIEKVIVRFDINTNPSANYRELMLADSTSGNLKDDVGSGNKQSGDPAKFNTPPTRVTINGNTGGPSGQSYIVRVQSPYTHLPDLRVQNYPAGDTTKMQILDFQRTGSDYLNVSGIPFKVELFVNFGDTTPVSTIYFTPNVY